MIHHSFKEGFHLLYIGFQMAALKCIICGSANAKACSTCKSSQYCGAECQKLDRPIHKLLCKAIGDVSARPSGEHKLGILFPADSKTPRLLWVECKTIRLPGDENAFHIPKVEPHLGNDNPSPGRMIITSNQYRSLGIDHTVIVHCRDNFRSDGSQPNLSAIETSEGKSSVQFKGPLLALHQIGDANEPYAFFKDVTLEDLRIVVDWFKTYGSTPQGMPRELEEMGFQSFSL
jgi:hypothetical protein